MRFGSVLTVIAFLTIAATAAAQSTASLKSSEPKTVATKSTASRDQSLIEGRVVFVQDGDTLHVRTHDRSIVQIRIQGIDAPEDGQSLGKEARKKLSELVANNEVTVVVHKKDPFGRSVATVYRKGRDVGLEMIRSGLAWHFKTYAMEQSAEDRKKYADAEAEARAAAIGIWSEKDPVPPWVHSGAVTSNEVQKEPSKEAASAASAPASSAATSGTGRKYLLGPRGGCYYIAGDGRKVYVKDKGLCGPEQSTTAKPEQ